MIGLSDNQLEIVMSTAEPLADETCQEFLERAAAAVAAILQVRGQINDEEVSAAVRLALRGLIENSAVWKNWNATSQNGQFDARLGAPALTTWRARRLLPWSTKLREWATQVFAVSPARGCKLSLGDRGYTASREQAMERRGSPHRLPLK
jgi:hypothetical protein